MKTPSETPLDRPAWHALNSVHLPLSVGDARARRYDPQVNRFASARDGAPDAQIALAALVQPGEQVYVLQVPDIAVPEGLVAVRRALGVQLVAQAPVAPPESRAYRIVALGPDDAVDMLALATLTEPGPFLSQTHRMGQFVGVRVDGRLAAMAGERFRFPGYTEVSGVCTHPDFRGHGLAKQLSRHVAAAIAARGETAFLHSWKDNAAAIALYEALGFQLRCEVQVAVLERA
ncbi:GNAT family N-acetyltransferase [Pseudoxanthomonas sp. GM95]|uniref:GNAT family N-acetyltransferase n=1 Tax=Pseudoxanthomonas sp. GM95 TaxID=1881043 RepID=UPI000B836B73|nr:GNAT family N-acetyltransferase [Pseudoxanthomonas sp. GM95]